MIQISVLTKENDLIYSKSISPKEFVNETLSNNKNQYGKFNYANIDYVLLGLIIEKFNKKSWKQSIQERILNKLEMTNTGFLEKNNYPKDFAYSFSFDNKKSRLADPLFFIENFYAAGCMYSNSKDLLKLDQAMYGNELISSESKTLMFTSYPEYNYSGYSVWTYNYPFTKSKPKIMERRGGILGANSVLIRILDTNKTIIILSNNNMFNPDSFGNTEGLKEALMIEVDESSH
jgi:CubicO group peptidase (beta-lactamase class C family)